MRALALEALHDLVALGWFQVTEHKLSHYGQVRLYGPVAVKALSWEQELTRVVRSLGQLNANLGDGVFYLKAEGRYAVQPLNTPLACAAGAVTGRLRQGQPGALPQSRGPEPRRWSMPWRRTVTPAG